MTSNTRPMHTISYYCAETERTITHRGQIVRSGAGWTGGVEYGVLYRLDDGRYLGGVRHQDRGSLMTDVRYADTATKALPARWR